LTPTLLSRTVSGILSLKYLGSWPRPFGVTWRHRSHDHKLVVSYGPLQPTVYLASLLR